MIPSLLQPLANHLWQSTVFAAVAGLLALALRRNRAQTRYWLWLAASLKFLIPFFLLVDVGSYWGRHTAPALTPPVLSYVIEQAGQPFSVPTPLATTTAAPGISLANWDPVVPSIVWAIGFAVLICSWWRRWRSLRTALRTASPLDLQIGMDVRISPAFGEPGVFGVRRPVLLLPAGIMDSLTPPQLEAIVAHELCHIRRRDNLATAIHMGVEALFWFHPLVWWLGARLMEERERACDEQVLLMGTEPVAYAEGILKVCELYLESPLACVAGVTGANLKRRIEAIVSSRIGQRLNRAKKLLLVSAGVAALAAPLVIGIAQAPAIGAQSRVAREPLIMEPASTALVETTSQAVALPAVPVQVTARPQPAANTPSPEKPLAFDAASIKPGHVPTGRQGTDGGGIVQIEPDRGVVFSRNGTVRRMILEAYHLMPTQLSGGPAWLDSDWFVLDAKAERPASANQLRQMLQTLLGERCKLVAHHETKEMLVYAVTVAKNGPKLHEIKEDDPEPGKMTSRERAIELWGSRNAEARAHWGGVGDLQQFLQGLPNIVSIDGSGVHPIDRPVLDKTGLHGHYWIQVGWDSDDDFIPAIQEELGLRFESQKAPVDVVVIDHIEKPDPN